METKLQFYYERMIEKLSTRSYNLLARNNLLVVQNILPWVIGKKDFHSLKGCGAISAEELFFMCEKLKDALGNSLIANPHIGDFVVNVPDDEMRKPAEPLLPETQTQTKKTDSKLMIPLREYLLQSDIDFICEFYAAKGTLPLFYILQAYKRHLRPTDDPVQYGMRSRIKSFLKQKEWLSYAVVKAGYVYAYRFRYEKLCSQEQITQEQLLSLLTMTDKKCLYVCPSKFSVLKTKPTEGEFQYFDLLLNDTLYAFQYNKMVKEVKRLSEMKRTKDESIPVDTYFIGNEDYWNASVQREDKSKKEALQLIEEIIESVFGSIVIAHQLVFKKTRTDYKDAVYQVLKDAGHRMHMADILVKIKELIPECGFTKPEQLRYYLTSNEKIIPVGKTSTFALREWGDMIGSIRELALKILHQQQEPVLIKNIANEILTYRPDSTYRSVTTIIQQCVESKELVLFFGDYVGLTGRSYDEKFIAFPRTFEEWLILYKQFVEEHGWHPLSGSTGVEGYLYRWAYQLNRIEGDFDDKKKRLSELREQLAAYPRTTSEIKFLRDCKSYKEMVKQNGRMVELWDDPVLCTWFNKWVDGYKQVSDGRKRYFEELLSFLEDSLDQPVTPQVMSPSEQRFIRNCNAYKKFVQEKGRKVERLDDPILFTWFDNCTHKYSSLNRKQQDSFDDLLQFLVEII